MLNTNANPLNAAEQDSFNRWLNAGDMKTLVRVIDAKAIALEVDATRDFGGAAKHSAKMEAGAGKLEKSARYRHALDVLKEVADQQTHATVTINTE